MLNEHPCEICTKLVPDGDSSSVTYIDGKRICGSCNELRSSLAIGSELAEIDSIINSALRSENMEEVFNKVLEKVRNVGNHEA